MYTMLEKEHVQGVREGTCTGCYIRNMFDVKGVREGICTEC